MIIKNLVWIVSGFGALIDAHMHIPWRQEIMSISTTTNAINSGTHPAMRSSSSVWYRPGVSRFPRASRVI